jgi:hypothetical protein
MHCCLHPAAHRKYASSVLKGHPAAFSLIECPVLSHGFCSPLIALDMLMNLEAPFRATISGMVLICLGIAVASANAEPPASYAWF